MSEELSEMSADEVLRQRAVGLLTFLRAFVGLRRTLKRSVDQYEDILWLDDIPQEPECACMYWYSPSSTDSEQSDETPVGPWVEVRKPRLREPPKLPNLLTSWVNTAQLGKSSLQAPEIYGQIAVEVQGDQKGEVATQFIQREECPDVQSSWADYLTRWTAWAEDDRRKQRVQSLYTHLYSLYQEQKELGETFEVVLGIGLLHWKLPNGQTVKRHVITAQTSLEFDPVRGIITVEAAGEGAKPRLEQDMLEPEYQPDFELSGKLEERLSSISDNLCHEPEIVATLRSYVHSIAVGQGEFSEEMKLQREATESPVILLAPALILRNRTNLGLIGLYDKMLRNLETSDEVPSGLRPLVAIEQQCSAADDETEDYGAEPRADRTELTSGHQVEYEELYFPLASNTEQREVIQRLSSRTGIVVQGPPGTGKSHTIANIVCHLLAQGKRVLVTSQTGRALRVLKDKLPKQITALCVILLGNDKSAIDELESSVNGITQKLHTWNESERKDHIEQLRSKLDELRREEASVNTKLRGIRESEVYRHPEVPGGYTGTAQEIAQKLRGEQETLGWLAEHACEVAELGDEPGVSNSEASRILEVYRQISPAREDELQKIFPLCETLLSPDQFESLVRAEEQAHCEMQERRPSCVSSQITLADEVPFEELKRACEQTTAVISRHTGVRGHYYEWTNRLADDMLADQDRQWRELYQQTMDKVAAIELHPLDVVDLEVTGHGDVDAATLRDDAKVIIDHVDGGGKLKGLLRWSRPVRDRSYIVRSVSIGGKPCRRLDAIRSLHSWADVKCNLRTLENLWSGVVEGPSGSIHRVLAVYKDMCEPLDDAIALHDAVQEAKASIQTLPATFHPRWHVIAEVESLETKLTFLCAAHHFREASNALADPVAELKQLSANPASHPSVHRLITAMESRSLEEYSRAYGEILRLCEDTAIMKEIHGLLERASHGADAAFSAMRTDCENEAWNKRCAELDRAWNWLRADRWLAQIQNPQYARELDSRRQRNRQNIHETVALLASEQGWIHCMARLRQDETQHAHLKAWMQSMKKIGRGTGKRAGKYRRFARELLDKCRPAIPAWIMPIYRVAETVEPRPEVFDVVIIDEASQCGIESLFIHLLGKQIIVVGDDNQIAPVYVGQKVDDVEALARRHLTDIPLKELYDLNNSLFSQAFVRFSERLRLREHFRCMPEIIQFSNSLSYRNEPLIPLRQYGTGRLEPVVSARYVREGYMEGRSPRTVNKPEAEAIVQEITRLVDDARYNGKTMGVISLLGDEQAHLIEGQLLEGIGPAEIERRRLICGNAYDFQGDERDVMFLSMVSAVTENRQIGVLSEASEEHRRRFNVAASRAKDQMLLFHSVTIQDLRPTCLRRRLLEYCLNPRVDEETLADIKVSQLRTLANAGHRDPTNLPRPFGSWFEVDVFLRIADRGYRVRPQYEMAGYRIDLVVEGLEGRLAVECDGDEWHGPDRYDEDMARQRQLERCGWIFWRIRGGTFYRDPEKSLLPLWRVLEEHGIRPRGEERSPSPDLSAKPDLPMDSADNCDAAQVSATTVPEQGEAKNGTLEVFNGDGFQGDASDHESPEEEECVERSEDSERFRLTSPTLPPKGLFDGDSAKCPDPRYSTPDKIRAALVGIIRQHGPMPCHYAYELYGESCGLGRLSRPIRNTLHRAVHSAVRRGEVAEENEYGSRDQMNKIVRGAGTPSVRVRPRGSRRLDQIAPSEIAAAMMEISAREKVIGHLSRNVAFRKVLDEYELSRLTVKARGILSIAYDIYWKTPSHPRT